MRRERSNNRGRGSSRGPRGGRGGYSGRGGRYDSSRDRRSYDGRRSVDGGNQRERIAVESGNLVLIDQFMLANPQFVDKVIKNIDADPEVKDQFVRDYGGAVVDLEPGTYRIERDPYAFTIVVHPEGQRPDLNSLGEQASVQKGCVFVDTRCIAMIDRELLDDSSLLEKYQQLWFSGQDKACRDLLRDNGGAVRYGFQRYGDELGLYSIKDQNIICLWPDVNEPEVPADATHES